MSTKICLTIDSDDQQSARSATASENVCECCAVVVAQRRSLTPGVVFRSCPLFFFARLFSLMWSAYTNMTKHTLRSILRDLTDLAAGVVVESE